VAIIGHQKGRTTKQKVRRNFGMAHPEGYRKAIRVMELANRYGRPVLTFIDTPGAYPGVGAEERGQSEAIGASIACMSGLRVPLVATIIAEGGSGGALALGVGNRVTMLEFATYSVITPEGCASILWRDGALAPVAAEQLKLLAADALRLGIVDTVVTEPRGGAHRDPVEAANTLREALRRELAPLKRMSGDELVAQRYAKFRAMGVTS
jgi:acetyl-CoA carboxylase carboxyl transferase subunit alpha